MTDVAALPSAPQPQGRRDGRMDGGSRTARRLHLKWPLASNLALAVLMAVMGWVGISYFSDPATVASPMWPPAGIALAVIVLWGPRLLPGVFVGAFTSTILASSTHHVIPALGSGLSNVLESFGGAWMLQRWAGGPSAFDRPNSVIRFLVIAAAAPVAGASVGVLGLLADGLPRAIAGEVWTTWYLGDVLGAWILAPTVVLFVRGERARHSHNPWEAGALCVAVAVTGLVTYGGPGDHVAAPSTLALALLPLLVWSAFRFGSRGVVGVISAYAVLAVAGTLTHHGPFGLIAQPAAFLWLQAALATCAGAGLVFGALVNEHRIIQQGLESRVEERTHHLKAREAELVEHGDRLAQAEATAHLGSWTWDVATNRITWSAELLRIYGRPRDSPALGYDDYLAGVHPDDRSFVDAQVKAAFAAKAPFAFEHRIQRPDGQVRWTQSRGIVQTDASGAVARMLGTALDVTERRAAAQALEESQRRLAATDKMAAVGTLTTGVAHEVRNPLTSIGMNLAIVQRLVSQAAVGHPELSQTQAGVEARVEAARSGVARIEEIVERLNRTAGADVQKTPHDLRSLVEEAIVTWEGGHGGAGGATTVSRSLDDVGQIPVDRAQIHQVLATLLENGAQAMANGGRIEVRLRRTGSGAAIEVEDHGSGIPDAVRQRLFDPFFTTKADGTGLGLSMSRRIIEAHGGELEFATSPNRGTVFRILLLRHAVAAGA